MGVNRILSTLKNLLYSPPLTVLLLIFSVYFTLKCRFFTPKAIKTTLKDLKKSLTEKGGGRQTLAAVATALGGTVGIGSIVGVGLGIAVGGVGSVFWMWVCSFFGMGLKFSEIKIALNGKNGGAPHRLKAIGYPGLGLLFCLLCVAASFGTGNLTQVGAIASFLESAGVPKLICGAACALAVGLAVFGGRKRIAGLNSFIVPAASALYILLCLAVLLPRFGQIPGAFLQIFKSAFGTDAAVGGFSAAALAATVREGFARSLFSGEAGMGSSPLAHGEGGTGSPQVQGEWGLFEIFFDTFVVSTLTALCLICCGTESPSQMFVQCFGRLGFLSFGALGAVFAFASVISWCYYAECCIAFAFKKRKGASLAYRALFTAAAFFGAIIPIGAIWDIADILNIMMMLPNLFMLFKCKNEIVGAFI